VEGHDSRTNDSATSQLPRLTFTNNFDKQLHFEPNNCSSNVWTKGEKSEFRYQALKATGKMGRNFHPVYLRWNIFSGRSCFSTYDQQNGYETQRKAFLEQIVRFIICETHNWCSSDYCVVEVCLFTGSYTSWRRTGPFTINVEAEESRRDGRKLHTLNSILSDKLHYKF
jgi:hypothetical protein